MAYEKDIDHFIKGDGLDSEREQTIGQKVAERPTPMVTTARTPEPPCVLLVVLLLLLSSPPRLPACCGGCRSASGEATDSGTTGRTIAPA